MYTNSYYKNLRYEFDCQLKLKVDAEENYNISSSALELIKLDVLKSIIRKGLDSSQESVNRYVENFKETDDFYELHYFSKYNSEVLSKKLLEWPSKIEKVYSSAKQILDESESSISPYKKISAAASLRVSEYEKSNNIENPSWVAKWLYYYLPMSDESMIYTTLFFGSGLMYVSIVMVLMFYFIIISNGLYTDVISGTSFYDAIIKQSAVVTNITTNPSAYLTFLGIYIISIGFGFTFRYKFILLPKWKYFVGWLSLIVFTSMAMILALKGSIFNSITAILGFTTPSILFGIYPRYEKLLDDLNSAEASESKALTEVRTKFYDHPEVSLLNEKFMRDYSLSIVSKVRNRITNIENLITMEESQKFELIQGIKELISDLIVRGEISKTNTIRDDANKLTNDFNLDFQVYNTYKMSNSHLLEKIESKIYPANVILDSMLHDFNKTEKDLELMFSEWDNKLNDAATTSIMNDLKS